eukprot:COSAG02_NODE_1043_length_15014_cov_8.766007_17_plen_83_part_00
MHSLLIHRQELLAQHKHVSNYTLWYPREQGQWADALSKLDLPYPNETKHQTGTAWLNQRLDEADLNCLEESFTALNELIGGS